LAVQVNEAQDSVRGDVSSPRPAKRRIALRIGDAYGEAAAELEIGQREDVREARA
jgi:hypothetical protein